MTISTQLKNISLSELYKEALALPDHDHKSIALGMAVDLLYQLYGRKWMSKHILTRENLAFLWDKSINSLAQPQLQMKILTLGECLFNLRGINGIQNILHELKNGNIESVVAELESGKFFFHRGLNFKYVTRSFKKKKDFDIQITDGTNELFCETKCKINNNTWSETSFQNSLHKAKQQLPTHSPSIILIKIPDAWGAHESQLRSISISCVKKSDRPLGIICWYESWKVIDEMYALGFMKGFEEHNEKSRIFNSRIIPFLPRQSDIPHWTFFQHFAAGFL